MRKEINGGVYYELPKAVLDASYRGAGNGSIVVEKGTDCVLGMDYFDLDDIEMVEDAGTVLHEDDHTITYRVNFSCCTACLF